MALVTVTINGYPHNVGCEDGQEGHLRAMAAEVDRRVQYLKTLGGQDGEAQELKRLRGQHRLLSQACLTRVSY